ncbi:MAG: CHAP domain-containing protein, partial [Lachnospiraceae bacterium]|nr:CHAP domain-containing protein [Lachnospiraceae bacterium]
RTIRVTKQTFTYDDENKLIDARVERLGMKALSEPSVTTYHYEYDENGNRTKVEIQDDNLTLESTVYTYDRLNRMVRSREVTANGLYIYEYSYDINGNLISEDRHRAYELNTNQYTNTRRYEYTKDNKLEAVYSGSTLLVAYTYDGDGLITSSLDRDLDLNQNLNINDRTYLNSLTQNQRQLINKVSTTDSILYELTEYVTDKNQTYTQTLMERDGTGQLSTIYTYGNQRINSESYNNLTGLYTYDGRGSVSAVIGGYGDFRASYWYDGLGNVKSQIHGYGAFGSGKKYYGYNAEQYNPVTGNQNLRARQLNIRRQRFLTEDTYLGNQIDILSINRYIYGNGNPIKYKDPSGFISNVIMSNVNNTGPGIGCGSGTEILDNVSYEMNETLSFDQALHNQQIDTMINWAIMQSQNSFFFENPKNSNNVFYNDWYYPNKETLAWCSVFVIYNAVVAGLGNDIIMPTKETSQEKGFQQVESLRNWYIEHERYYEYSSDYVPKKGDVFFMDIYNSNGKLTGHHTGFVVSYDGETGVIHTVEGNTNIKGSNEGDGVYVKDRKKGLINKIKGFGDNHYDGE